MGHQCHVGAILNILDNSEEPIGVVSTIDDITNDRVVRLPTFFEL